MVHPGGYSHFDADSNLTSFTDATGTTSRSYDNDCRLTSESKGGSTVVSYSYDGTGQLGLLSSTTDSNGRTISRGYDSLNRLTSVAETAGTTYYSYDAGSNLMGVTNQNGTTVTRVYDHTGKLTSITNASVISGVTTTLSSYSYGYDASGRKSNCTENSGDTVSWGYDWAGRLTSEVRTGSNAYSTAYTLDAEGRRTSQSVTSGGTTKVTNFTVDSDDEVTAASSSSGGLNNRRSADKTHARHTLQPHLAAKNERSKEMHGQVHSLYGNRLVGDEKCADRQNPCWNRLHCCLRLRWPDDLVNAGLQHHQFCL